MALTLRPFPVTEHGVPEENRFSQPPHNACLSLRAQHGTAVDAFHSAGSAFVWGWHVTWQWPRGAICPISAPWLFYLCVLVEKLLQGVCPCLRPLHPCGMEFPEERVVTGVTALVGLPFWAALG